MKKLQGTRAGRPIAIAFDTELLMEMGTKLFATDEAVLSPDWVSNVAMINTYDMRTGEFFFISRAYASHRLEYQAVLKEAKENYDPNDVLTSKTSMFRETAFEIFGRIKQRVDFGQFACHTLAHPGLSMNDRSRAIWQGKGSQDRQKGKGKESKGQGKDKGKGKHPPGGVTYYNDFVGKSGWDQGYRFTWYWNERRGWFRD